MECLRHIGNVTERDLDILEFLLDGQCATTFQLERRFFSRQSQSRRLCQRVIARLRDKQLIWQAHQPTQHGQGSLPRLNYLDSKGYEVLAWFRGRHQGKAPKKRIAYKPVFLAHRLAVNDARITLELAADRLPRVRMARWVDEQRFRSDDFRDYVKIRAASGRQVGVPFLPDGVFVVEAQQVRDGESVVVRYHCVLEVDRGTESAAKWRDKVAAYTQYLYEGGWTRRFGTEDMRVFTVTPSELRTATLLRATTDIQGRNRFLYAGEDEMTVETALTGAIWRSAGDRHLRRMVPDEGGA